MNQDAPHAHVMGMKSGALRNRIAAQQMAQAMMSPQAAPIQQAPVQQQVMTPQAAMGQPMGLMGLGNAVIPPKRRMRVV